MYAQTVERPAMNPIRPVFPRSGPGVREFRLPLRSELFLIAHDDDTGHCHLSRRALCRGLAGALLLELWISSRIQIGWRYDARSGEHSKDPGRIVILDPTPTGDPLADAALLDLRQTGGALRVADFLKRFVTADLYDQVQADLITRRVLRRTTRRRFGLFRRDICKPVHNRLPVRARGRVREIFESTATTPVIGVDDHQITALAGLVAALGLTRYVCPQTMSAGRLHQKLVNLIHGLYNPTVRDVVTAINPRHRPSRRD